LAHIFLDLEQLLLEFAQLDSVVQPHGCYRSCSGEGNGPQHFSMKSTMDQHHAVYGLQGEKLSEQIFHPGVPKLGPMVGQLGGLDGHDGGISGPFGNRGSGHVKIDLGLRDEVGSVCCSICLEQMTVVGAFSHEGERWSWVSV